MRFRGVSHCRSETLLHEGSRQAESGRGLPGQAALNKELAERSSKHSISWLRESYGSGRGYGIGIAVQALPIGPSRSIQMSMLIWPPRVWCK